MMDMTKKMEKMSAGDAKKLAATYMKMGGHLPSETEEEKVNISQL